MDEENQKVVKKIDSQSTKLKFKDGFHILNIFLQLCGFHDIFLRKSKKNRMFQIIQKTVYTIGYIQMIPLVIGEFINYYFLLSDGKLLEFAELTPCTSVCILGMIKSSIVLLKREKLCKLYDNLKKIWPDQDDENVKKIVTDNIPITIKFITLYMAQMNLLSLYWCIIPIITIMYNLYLNYIADISMRWNNNVHFPFNIWYPFETMENWFVFLPTFISQIYAGTYVSSLMSCLDCLFCLLIAHICMHFQILRKEMKALKKSENINKDIKQLITKHLMILRLIKDIQDIYSLQLFLNLLFSLIILCMQLFCFTISPLNKAPKYGFFVSTALIQISLICFYGNKLQDEGEAMKLSSYESEWWDSNVSHKNAVMMVQIRSTYPTTIFAMDFIAININTLATILNTSWSYFTILRNVYQPEID